MPLTAGCEDLERKMTQLSLSYDALEAVVEDEAERNRLYEEFEVVSRENNEALRMVGERINFLQQERDSKSSMISQLTKSSKISDKSSCKSSHSSSRYSSLSSRQKRVQLEGDIASLRATMALAKERRKRNRTQSENGRGAKEEDGNHARRRTRQRRIKGFRRELSDQRRIS